jgi:hypothetical protein
MYLIAIQSHAVFVHMYKQPFMKHLRIAIIRYTLQYVLSVVILLRYFAADFLV